LVGLNHYDAVATHRTVCGSLSTLQNGDVAYVLIVERLEQ
jgi:hypothetical protein